jgi:asparagine synthetase B (glutamine-hydrolysing)
LSWVASLDRYEGVARLVVTVDEPSTAPERLDRDGCTIILDGRVDGEAEAVLRAYLRDGEHALRGLAGWFTLVVWDARAEVLFVVRDPLGIQSVFYASLTSEFRVSPTRDALLRSGVPAEPNAPAIAAYLMGYPPSAGETFFTAISRLPPGHMLTLRSAAARVERYWDPSQEVRPAANEDAAARLEELLRAAVGRCLAIGQAGVFLSGGLDSALVAAIAADLCREHGSPPPLALTILFTGTDVDEEPTQRAVASGLALEQVAMTPQEAVGRDRVLLAALELAADSSSPPELLQPIYDRLTLVARERGFAVLLSGAGGDEVLMPPPTYASERFCSLDVPTLAQLGRASLDYWPGATRRSVVRSLVIRRGVRPLLVAGAAAILGRVAPDRLRRLREVRAARLTPEWLVPDPKLRSAAISRRSRPARFLDDVSLSYVGEQAYETRRRLRVHTLAPLLDPDVVAFLSSLEPRRLIARGKAKALAREVLVSRLPHMAWSWPRTVYADSLWRQALVREGAHAWSALGGAPTLAELGIVDPTLLGARVCSHGTSIPRREVAQACRALILEKWMRSHILPPVS